MAKFTVASILLLPPGKEELFLHQAVFLDARHNPFGSLKLQC